MSVEAKLDVLVERTKTIKDDVKSIKEDIKTHAKGISRNTERVAKVEGKTNYAWGLLVPIVVGLLALGFKAIAG